MKTITTFITLLFGVLTSSAFAVPDLDVLEVLAPPTLIAGEPFDTTWTVLNIGTEATTTDSW